VGKTCSIQLGGAQLGAVRHACAFFDGEDQAYRALLPFIAEGFACGHKAIHVVRGGREADHLRRLEERGIDVGAACAAGQLEMRTDSETYLEGGRFDGDRLLAAFEDMASGAPDARYPLSRIVCDMGWSADHPLAREALIAFEARVNAVWSRHDDVVICAYDVKALTGDMLIDIMRTHPLVMIGEVLQTNPFFVPPDQFLRERAARARHGYSVP
jgi:hypothetical protein